MRSGFNFIVSLIVFTSSCGQTNEIQLPERVRYLLLLYLQKYLLNLLLRHPQYTAVTVFTTDTDQWP